MVQLLDSTYAFGDLILKRNSTKANLPACGLFVGCPFQVLSFSCLDIDGNHWMIQYRQGKWKAGVRTIFLNHDLSVLVGTCHQSDPSKTLNWPCHSDFKSSFNAPFPLIENANLQLLRTYVPLQFHVPLSSSTLPSSYSSKPFSTASLTLE